MIKVCFTCGLDFETSHKKRRCCSVACSAAWRKIALRGDKNPNWKGGQYNKVCRDCGISFIAKYCRTEYCPNHRGAANKRNANWNGGKESIHLKCGCCKSSFSCTRSSKRSGRKYCSHACSNIIKNKRNKKKRTDIEIMIEDWLIQNKISYKTQEPIAGITLADFVVNKTVIFCDGDYWHSLPGRKEKDKTQTKKLIALGFNVIRLSETDIKNGVRPILYS